MLAPRHNVRKRQQFLNGFRVELRTFYLLGWAETGRSFRHRLVRVADMLVFLGQTMKNLTSCGFFWRESVFSSQMVLLVAWKGSS